MYACVFKDIKCGDIVIWRPRKVEIERIIEFDGGRCDRMGLHVATVSSELV